MGIGKENKEMNIAYLHDQMKQYNEQHNPHAELNVALRTKLKAMQNIEADLRSEISQLNERLVAKQVSEKDRSDWQAATEQIINKQQEKDRKSTRLNSSHVAISYAVFCLKKKK